MSATLSTLLRAFVGDAESAVTLVAEGITRAVFIAGKDGTRAPLVNALAEVAGLKGNALRIEALRAGLVSAGLVVSPGFAPIALDAMPGLSLGKMSATDARALADATAEAFTLSASAYLTAPKAKGKKIDKVAGALATLAACELVDLRKRLTKGDGATLMGMIRTMLAEDEQAKAKADADKAIAGATRTATAQTPAEEPATV